jgi:hypothetical protein
MDDQQQKNALLRLLESEGFSAALVAEADVPTPDVRATDPAGTTYLIELKERTVAWPDRAHSECIREGRQVITRQDAGGASDTVSRVLKKAARQLQSSDQEKGKTVRLVWFLADQTDQEYHYDVIRNTAYGIRYVVAWRDGKIQTREGIYVSHAEFMRWRDVIDGIILGPLDVLLLNDLSSRYPLLRESYLAEKCSNVCDPVALAESGLSYYLSPTGEAPSEEAACARLESIYGLSMPKILDFPRFSAAVVEPGFRSDL